jgi:hypothetical protein
MAASKEDEVLAIAEAHRAAQARVGIAGAYLAIAEWGSVDSQNASESGSSWVSRSLKMIIALRRKSTRLAVTYIRLTRALETGYTLGYPEFADDPKTLTMGDLREQFRELLLEIATMDTTESNSTDQDEQWFDSELRRAEADQHLRNDGIVFSDTNLDEPIQSWLDSAGNDDADSVKIEPFDWGKDMTPDDVKQAFQDALNQDVLKAHDEKVRKLRENADATAAQTMDGIRKANEASGNLGGGRVDRYGINAGREVLNHVWDADKRVAAYARVCRPNACAFCSMLAARGFVYHSKFSAGDNDLNRYHDHCHCYVILRYVDVPNLPPLNKYLQAAYQREVIDKGYKYTPATTTRAGVNNALNAWRRWLNQQRRADGTYDPKRR